MNEDEIVDFSSDNPETAVWSVLLDMDIDPLTGLPNRRKGEEVLQKEMDRAKAGNSLLTLVFMDIDNFKPVNTKHGHKTGDSVLVDVFRAVRDSFRPADTVVRYGGDEAYAICPGVEWDEKDKLEERIREKIQEYLSNRPNPSSIPEMSNIGITLAIGKWNRMEASGMKW